MKEYVEMGLLLDAISVSKLDYLAVTDVVCKVPTADVAPVVHGKWKELPNQNEHLARGLHKFVCSICGSGMYGEPNYCPHCGARMDGEK